MPQTKDQKRRGAIARMRAKLAFYMRLDSSTKGWSAETLERKIAILSRDIRNTENKLESSY